VIRQPWKNIPILNKAVCRVNQIVIRTSLCLKLYLISSGPTVVDALLIGQIMRLVTTGKPSGNSHLDALYKDQFLSDEPLSGTGLNEILNGVSVRMVDEFEINIKQRFPNYVSDLVGVILQRRKFGRGSDEALQLQERISVLTDDILSVSTEWKSDPTDHKLIQELKDFALPPKKKFERDSIRYDVHCHPQDYFPFMLKITKRCEEEPDPALRSCIPLHTDTVPRFVSINTRALKELFGRNWDTIFYTSNPEFQAEDGFLFADEIDTDGVSCSIIHKGGVQFLPEKHKLKPIMDRYITELTESEREMFRARKVVGIDPNKHDLLFCMSETSTAHKAEKFRYTENQRRVETRYHQHNEYSQVVQERRRTELVEGRTIAEWIDVLRLYNLRTVDPEKFKVYIQVRLYVNSKVTPFNEEYETRKKLGLHSILIQRSERDLVRRFREKFGGPDTVIIGIGEACRSKYYLQLLRHTGYPIFLVDEFRTTCGCFACRKVGVACVTFRERPDGVGLVHGLLKCTGCGIVWNRDSNASLNIALLTRCALEGDGRPEYLGRRKLRSEA
jgi:hypothetical protein